MTFLTTIRQAAARLGARDLAGAAHVIREALAGKPAAAPPRPETAALPEPKTPRPEPKTPLPETPPPEMPAEMPAPTAPTRAPDRPAAKAAPRLPMPRRRLPLGEALRLLREGIGAAGFPALMTRRVPPPAVPPGARFESRNHASEAGERAYRLYVPSRADRGLRGLVVMLHGCKQDPDDFATGTGMNAVAERERLLVAYPGQSRAHNPLRCWNWFNPGNQQRDAGEPAIIAGIARSLLEEFAVEDGRAMVAGLSAGGSMAAVLGATYPDLFEAVGIHSGLVDGAANDAASALAAMRGEGEASGVLPLCRTIVFHGDADETVHPDNAARILAAAGAGTLQRREGRSAGGRRFGVEALLDRSGRPRLEVWMVEETGHAWSGGRPEGSYTDPDGPDASAEMVRFFLAPKRGRLAGFRRRA